MRTGEVDRTRYHVYVEDNFFPSLSQRRAVLFVVKDLVDRSQIPPKRIAEAVGQNFSSIWFEVEGRLNEQQIESETLERARTQGRSLDANEWFTKDEQLIFVDGKTYAFKGNIWGEGKWRFALEKLAAAFPNKRIRFEPVPNSEQDQLEDGT